MSINGNHHHRHQASSGDGPHFYDPRYFLSKDEVDAVGDEIDKARKRPARKYKLRVPEEAINECQDSHTAANANKQKADTGHFDDTGVAALVCRHGIPIFFANIDTPGEQQKYAIALIRRVFSELPPEATGAFLYDIGCVLDVSINKVSRIHTSIHDHDHVLINILPSMTSYPKTSCKESYLLPRLCTPTHTSGHASSCTTLASDQGWA